MYSSCCLLTIVVFDCWKVPERSRMTDNMMGVKHHRNKKHLTIGNQKHHHEASYIHSYWSTVATVSAVSNLYRHNHEPFILKTLHLHYNTSFIIALVVVGFGINTSRPLTTTPTMYNAFKKMIIITNNTTLMSVIKVPLFSNRGKKVWRPSMTSDPALHHSY